MKVKDYFILVGTLCWLISLISFKRQFPKYLKILSFFILVTILTEWTSWYIVRKLGWKSIPLYNFYNIIEFMFLPYLYYMHLHSHRLKRIIFYFIMFFPVLTVINMLFVQGIHTFNTYTYLVGNLFMISLIFFYFRQIIQSPTYEKPSRNPMFFISAGYLLFFVIEIPYTLLLPYFAKHDLQVAMTFIWIIKILNIVLYLSLSIAYLCQPATRK